MRGDYVAAAAVGAGAVVSESAGGSAGAAHLRCRESEGLLSQLYDEFQNKQK